MSLGEEDQQTLSFTFASRKLEGGEGRCLGVVRPDGVVSAVWPPFPTRKTLHQQEKVLQPDCS